MLIIQSLGSHGVMPINSANGLVENCRQKPNGKKLHAVVIYVSIPGVMISTWIKHLLFLSLQIMSRATIQKMNPVLILMVHNYMQLLAITILVALPMDFLIWQEM